MASDLTSELHEFEAFVFERLESIDDLTLEQSLDRFRQYQRELASVRQKLQVAEDQSTRGESRPLDAHAIKAEVRNRLTADGLGG